MMSWQHGALLLPDSTTTRFRVWAPLARQVNLLLQEGNATHQMKADKDGYFEITISDCPAGSRYWFQLDDDPPRPDPASRWQPEGVHLRSAVVEPRFDWNNNDTWAGLPLEEYVIYEFHVGTFTQAGTFDAAISELPRLKDLGISAVEVMPIAQFPGNRNWGYDGAYPYAAQDSYGGLAGFHRFVDAAHGLNLAVVLDVVYNHLGPEGNYLSCFGPYFTEEHRTPWGSAINFDAPYSDGVRDYFIGNAMFWMEWCQVDALRLDAVHAILDTSADPFLRQLTDTVHSLGRSMHKRLHVMGENDRNDPKFTRLPELGGVGADTQWSDDFHHALHAVLTRENHGYYKDFGKVSQLAKAYTDGFVYDGCYSPSRKRHHGADSRDLEGVRFIACAQNHDQIGNRPLGDRLSMILDFPRTKLAAVAVLSAPYIPLLFMGEETASKSPFLYFVSHGDEELIEAVRLGRQKEFHEFFSTGEAPDPQQESTYNQSKVRPDTTPHGKAVNRLYRDLLRLRKKVEALQPTNKRQTTAIANDLRQTLILTRESNNSIVLCLFNFSDLEQRMIVNAAPGEWKVLLDTESPAYEGSGAQTQETIACNGEMVLTLQKSTSIILQHRNSQQQANSKKSQDI